MMTSSKMEMTGRIVYSSSCKQPESMAPLAPKSSSTLQLVPLAIHVLVAHYIIHITVHAKGTEFSHLYKFNQDWFKNSTGQVSRPAQTDPIPCDSRATAT
jgi:hypothetical protein